MRIETVLETAHPMIEVFHALVEVFDVLANVQDGGFHETNPLTERRKTMIHFLI